GGDHGLRKVRPAAEATLVTLDRKFVELAPLVADVLRDAIVRRFGPRRTGYVPNLRQSVRRRLGLNVRGHVWCWCDGVSSVFRYSLLVTQSGHTHRKADSTSACLLRMDFVERHPILHFHQHRRASNT